MIEFSSHTIFQLLQKLLPTAPIIIEAGAFTGHDTVRFADGWPKGTIHAFEPVPELYEQLVLNTKELKNVFCHPHALATHNGTTTLHLMHKKNKPTIPSQASSLLLPKDMETMHPKMTHTTNITVPCTTLQHFALQHAFDHIDLVWLDLQGAELMILKNSADILSRIDFIFTEVNFVARYEQQPSYEALKIWLENRGFKEIGRDFQDTTGQRFGNVLFTRLDI